MLKDAQARLSLSPRMQITLQVAESSAVQLAQNVCYPDEDLALLLMSRSFLENSTEEEAAFALFHELGHVYCRLHASAQGVSTPPSHDEEFACDYIAGWLFGEAGFVMLDVSQDEHFGATGIGVAPCEEAFGADGLAMARMEEDNPLGRILRLLGLLWKGNGEADSTHPHAFERVCKAALTGYLDAIGGNRRRF